MGCNGRTRSLHGVNKELEKVTVKVWGVVQGPMSVDDLPDDEEMPEDKDMEWFMVCKTEVCGVVEDTNFWFEDLDQAYTWQKYFTKQIEPIVIEGDVD